MYTPKLQKGIVSASPNTPEVSLSYLSPAPSLRRIGTLLLICHPFFPFPQKFYTICVHIYIYQFSSVAQSCPTLCNPMNRSTPGLPVHHQLPEITGTHIHRLSDAIQPSHPLSSPSPPAPNPSQHQSLLQ